MGGVVMNLYGNELVSAAMLGVLRTIESIQKRRKPIHGAKLTTEWQMTIEGCLGEYVVAKYLNQFWPGVGYRGGPDVGRDVEVRTTPFNTNRLIIRKGDKDDKNYWLVTGYNGKYVIQGWITGKDAKQDKYWDNPANRPPAFFVPIKDLNKVEQLCSTK